MKYVLTDGGLSQVFYLYNIKIRPNIFCLDAESFMDLKSYLSSEDEVVLFVHGCTDISYRNWLSVICFLQDLDISFTLFSDVFFPDLDYYEYSGDLLSGEKFTVSSQKNKVVREKIELDVLMQLVAGWKVPDENITVSSLRNISFSDDSISETKSIFDVSEDSNPLFASLCKISDFMTFSKVENAVDFNAIPRI